MTIAGVRWINFGTFNDARGKLCFAEVGKQLPFTVQRVYYSYEVPANTPRAGHGHRELEQVIVALGGSFNFIVSDGVTRETYCMDNPAKGLYVPKMLWREVEDYSPGAVCLVLASLPYDPGEYIKDYDEFLRLKKKLMSQRGF